MVVSQKTVQQYGNKKFVSKLSLIVFCMAVVSVPTYANDIPESVSKVMKKHTLTSNEFSFIVTPLISSNTSTNRLPIDKAQKKLHEQIAEEKRAELVKKGLLELESDVEANTELNNSLTTPVTQPLTTKLQRSYSHLATQPRIPASTMKLIPTFVALDSLGKDFVWWTKAYYSGYRIGNTLYGDLIIKGSGDPKFTHHKLAKLLSKVQQLGITHIKGDIIIDSSVFHNVTKDPAKFDNDPLRAYNASPDGTLVNFSTLTIGSSPIQTAQGENSGQSQLIYEPTLADIALPQQISQRNGKCQSIHRSLAPAWKSNELVFNKGMPNGCGQHSFYIAYPNGRVFAQQVTKAKWLAMGNSLDGDVHNMDDIKDADGYNAKSKFISPFAIAIEGSYPLSEQIYDINHHSNNVMTEQVMLSIPVYANDKNDESDKNSHSPLNTIYGKVNSTDYPKAIATVNNWWAKNLTSPPPYMTNGSGLCRSCTVTVTNLNDLLGNAYEHPDFSVYVNSLGVAGVSGTIATHKYRRPDSQAIGRAWIKTGTLNNVTAMAGYVKGNSGQEYSVVGIINLPKGKRGANQKRPVLDALIDWVAQH